MKIFIEKEREEKIIEFKKNINVKDLLIKLNINPETVIVSKNDELVVEEDILENNDEIKILSVVSGG